MGLIYRKMENCSIIKYFKNKASKYHAFLLKNVSENTELLSSGGGGRYVSENDLT